MGAGILTLLNAYIAIRCSILSALIESVRNGKEMEPVFYPGEHSHLPEETDISGAPSHHRHLSCSHDR